MASITLNNLWNFIQSMSLSANNELWLAEKLHESAQKKQQANKAYNIAEEKTIIVYLNLYSVQPQLKKPSVECKMPKKNML